MARKKIGPYEIIRELGQPGLSEVYLAYNKFEERQVVIKSMLKQHQDSDEFRTRFKREAKILAHLENAPIVPMHQFTGHGGRLYIVMRYMAGGTLKDLIKGEPLSLDQIFPIVDRMAEALDATHRKGIIHRDLKPSNILFDENGVAFLSDFGLAKQLDASRHLTPTDAEIGTPLYMSPEQVRDPRYIDGRSDIYSLGVILYEMLTGKHPYADTSNMYKIYEAITKGEVPELTVAQLAKLRLPPYCNHILAKSLAKDCDQRYAKASDMAEDVARLRNFAASTRVDPIVKTRKWGQLRWAGLSPAGNERRDEQAKRPVRLAFQGG